MKDDWQNAYQEKLDELLACGHTPDAANTAAIKHANIEEEMEAEKRFEMQEYRQDLINER